MNTKNEIIQILARSQDALSVSDIVALTNGARPYISKLLSELYADEKLVRRREGRNVYYSINGRLTFINRSFKLLDLDEWSVMEEVISNEEFKKRLSENVISVFEYAFSEMLNNAIDHSKSTMADIDVYLEENQLYFSIRDFGIGVFKNIQKKKGLEDELSAIQDLLKGKTTTFPEAHSGEGIFFTSKAVDVFELSSYEYKLRVDNKINDIFVEEISEILEGTEVNVSIDADNNRDIADLFRGFSYDPSEPDFDVTVISIKLYKNGTVYISRSQAKRLLVGLDKFKKIILDFSDIQTVGQAFADEIFRVYKSKHKSIEIDSINMNSAVEFMVKRAQNNH